MPRTKTYETPEAAKEAQKRQIKTYQQRAVKVRKLMKEQAHPTQRLIVKILSDRVYKSAEDLIRVLQILEQSPFSPADELIAEQK